MPALLRAADSQDGQRTDLKVLLITDNPGSDIVPPHYAYDSWRKILDQEGVPYDTFNVSDAATTLTPAFLADDAANHARYQAIIMAPGNLADDDPNYDKLTSAEKAALADFQVKYGIRQITDALWPTPFHGLTPRDGDIFTGEQGGRVGTLTAAGKALFPELKGDVPVSTGSYGALASPGGTFQTLVESPTVGGVKSPYVGINTRLNGIEEMVLPLATSNWTKQGQLLRRGMIRWVTRGVHLGSARTYYSAHIDDIFLPNTLWDTVQHCTPGNDAPLSEGGTCDWGTATPDGSWTKVKEVRMVPADTAAAKAWQETQGIKFDFAYNGWGYRRNTNTGATTANDPLGDDPVNGLLAVPAVRDAFRWINHTWSHEQLDELPLNAPVNDSTGFMGLNQQIALNRQFAIDKGLPIAQNELVTGEHSGLGSYAGHTFPDGTVGKAMNGDMPDALTQNGIAWVGDDASIKPNQRQVGPATSVPRHPSNIYYNVYTRGDQVNEYNWVYLDKTVDPTKGNCDPVTRTDCRSTAATWADYAKSESDIMFNHLVDNDPRPHYMHQPNLITSQNGGQGIMFGTGSDHDGVLDRLFAQYDQYYNRSVAPITNPTMTEAGVAMRQQAAWSAAKNGVTAYIQNGKVTITTSGSLAVPVTGTTVGSIDTDARSGWQTVNGTVALDVTPLSAPTVTGSPVLGQTLTATAAKWGSGRSAIGGAWVRCDAAGANCVPIAGATALTYQVGASDLGKSVRYRETGLWTRGVGDSAQQVVPQVVPAVITPDATGGMAPGAVVTVAPLANWGGTTGGTSTKQWVICTSATDTTTCTPIAGVTGVTYTLVPGDVDKWVRHREAITVTSNDNGVTYSNALRVVATPITLTPTNPPVAPKCPTRPQFNSIIFKDGVTSFYYRPQPGQEIRGARRLGTAKLKALLDTPKGRSTLPRLEYTTATPVDARRLPWFARKIGPNRVVTAIMSDATSSAYSGVRLAYPPKKGTYAKLILPNGTVQTLRADCPKVTGYKTIYAQNIFVNRTSK